MARPAADPTLSSELPPEPIFRAPLQRLMLGQGMGSNDLAGDEPSNVGLDLVDVWLLTRDGDPVQATFMLDSGLSLNLLAPDLPTRLNLSTLDTELDSFALGTEAKTLPAVEVPGVSLLAPPVGNSSLFTGVWEGGGWRSLCRLDWETWRAKAAATGGRMDMAAVEYSVLPSAGMTGPQLEDLVGLQGVEYLDGEVSADGSRFVGHGVAVEPKGFLATSDRYELQQDGEELLQVESGTRLRPAPAVIPMRLPGPMYAACVPFSQADVALAQGVKLSGMLGQVPFHKEFALDVDPVQKQLALHETSRAARAAKAAGLVRLPGEPLPSRVFAVQLLHAPLLGNHMASTVSLEAGQAATVPAMVDSGSSCTILNWPAAEKLLGLNSDARIVQEAPRFLFAGVGGGSVELPLLKLSVGLGAPQDGRAAAVRPKPVRVAIGDLDLFVDLFGREASGSWPFGLGPQRQLPAALIGQDLLSQDRYVMAAGEPALYMAEEPGSSGGVAGELSFVGLGDCLDAGGRRLRGLQRLSCTPDEAAWECLRMPAGTCRGVAVTPLTHKGDFSGLCYIFVEDDAAAEAPARRGFRRYEAQDGQELAPLGAGVAAATGADGAECYAWRHK